MNNILKYFLSLLIFGLCFPLHGAIEISNITYTSGNGACDGAIEVKAEGTAGPFNISLTELDGTSVDYVVDINGSYTFSGLCADTYNVSVSSELVCEQTIEVDLESCIGNLTITETVLNPCGSVWNIIGQQTIVTHPGAIYIEIEGGTPPYSYQWSDSDMTTKDREFYASTPLIWNGTYCITVTDNCGLQESECYTTNALQLVSIQPISGCGTDDGQVLLNVTGGIPPYSYEWSNGETTQNITNLASGEYTVTVQDAVGCLLEESVTIQGAFEIDENDPCEGFDNGSITLNLFNPADDIYVTLTWLDGTPVFSGSYPQSTSSMTVGGNLESFRHYLLKITIGECESTTTISLSEKDIEKVFSEFVPGNFPLNGKCHYDLYCEDDLIREDGAIESYNIDYSEAYGNGKRFGKCGAPAVCSDDRDNEVKIFDIRYSKKKERSAIYNHILTVAENQYAAGIETYSYSHLVHLRNRFEDKVNDDCQKVRYCPATLEMKTVFTVDSKDGIDNYLGADCYELSGCTFPFLNPRYCVHEILPSHLLLNYYPSGASGSCNPAYHNLHQIDLWHDYLIRDFPNTYPDSELYDYILDSRNDPEIHRRFPCSYIKFCKSDFTIFPVTLGTCDPPTTTPPPPNSPPIVFCDPITTTVPDILQVRCFDSNCEGCTPGLGGTVTHYIYTEYSYHEFNQRIASNGFKDKWITNEKPTHFVNFGISSTEGYKSPKGIFMDNEGYRFNDFSHHAKSIEHIAEDSILFYLDDWDNDIQIAIETTHDNQEYRLIYEDTLTSWEETIYSNNYIDINHLSKVDDIIYIGGQFKGSINHHSIVLGNTTNEETASFLLTLNEDRNLIDNYIINNDKAYFSETAKGVGISFIATEEDIDISNARYSTTIGNVVNFEVSNTGVATNSISSTSISNIAGRTSTNETPFINISSGFTLLKSAQSSNNSITYLLSGNGDIITPSETYNYTDNQLVLLTTDSLQNMLWLQTINYSNGILTEHLDIVYGDENSLYVGLTYQNNITFGDENTVMSAGGEDIILIKYSSCGQVEGYANYGNSDDQNLSKLMYNKSLLYFGGDIKGTSVETIMGKYKFLNLTQNNQNAYISYISDEYLNTDIETSSIEVANIKHAFVGQCNGTITLSENASSDNTYSWTGADNFTSSDANLSGLCAGTYTLVITNSGGCQQEITAIVTECTIDIEPKIQAVCFEGGTGSIAFTSSNTNEYTFTWANGQTGTESGNLQTGSHCVTITNIAENCSVEQCYTIESLTDVTSDDYASCLPNSAPIIINEVSNGSGGSKEYVELLVVGDGSCNNVDIRGYIIDDNNGDFSNTSSGYSSSGIAGGHIRFAFVSQWSSVPVGSIILLYNAGDKNPSITLADDPTDSDADKVYVLPHTDSSLEGVSVLPVAASDSLHSHYSPSQHTYGSASWSYLALYNSRDAIQIRYPNGTYCHGVSYGGSSYMTGGPDDLRLRPYSSSKKAFFFNSGDFTDSANFDYDNVSNGVETPGYVNNIDNESFINNICNSGATIRTKDSEIIKANAPVFVGRVYPNPFTKSIHFDINSTREQEINITLYDLLGKVVHSSKHNVNIGFNTLSINTVKTSLAEGVYQIIIIDSMGKQHKQRLVHTK